MDTEAGVGQHLRNWRELRGLSQMELAERAAVSARHLSFVETGRSQASRELLLRLSDALEIPLRARNAMLLAGGFSSEYRETGLSEPEMTEVRRVLEFILQAQEPYPAMVIDRYWNVMSANAPMQAVARKFARKPAAFPPNDFNLMRAVLHPDGMRSHIVNLAEFEPFMLGRVRRQLEAGGQDERMSALYDELQTYPDSAPEQLASDERHLPHILMPIHLRRGKYEIRMFTTIATLGAPRDITLQELAIECAFPSDPESDKAIRALTQ